MAPTSPVTDANLVLGRLNPDYFLGGRMRLDVDAAERVVAELAAELGCSPRAAALAVIEIANENMVAAIGERTVEIGIDPRRFTLVSFGGAGALHGAALARRLGIGRVLVPPTPGLCSAFGALSAELRSDRSSTVRTRSDALDVARLDARVQALREQTVAELASEGFAGKPRLSTRVAMRYLGQNYEHEVELPDPTVTAAAAGAAIERFEALHEAFYGYQLASEVIEIVQVSVTAVGESTFGAASPHGNGSSRPPERRKVSFRDEPRHRGARPPARRAVEERADHRSRHRRGAGRDDAGGARRRVDRSRGRKSDHRDIPNRSVRHVGP